MQYVGLVFAPARVGISRQTLCCGLPLLGHPVDLLARHGVSHCIVVTDESSHVDVQQVWPSLPLTQDYALLCVQHFMTSALPGNACVQGPRAVL